MIRKPTSGDSEQRNHESERARKSSELHAGTPIQTPTKNTESKQSSSGPAHGSSDGESAHGALPRDGIEFEQGD
ncbi:MAG TPA: hypothetical protein VM100_01795 [Longimicrobiales bacterium]|nr:hypothetical protein [Longimicrobiales bacterium]